METIKEQKMTDEGKIELISANTPRPADERTALRLDLLVLRVTKIGFPI